MRFPTRSLLLLLPLTSCVLPPSAHWEKAGASETQYTTELNQCKGASYSGTDGMVTREMVRRMEACMQAKGWRKVPN